MTAPDYDWETDSSLKGAVSCVSLGSYCAVASALNLLKLRDAAYPFDWNRTTLDGVIHFLETRFSDFMHFISVKDFEGGKDTGGKAYCGAHHSVWHENLATEDGNEKYRRRISRFYENASPRILFIRCMNSSTELGNAVALFSVLQKLFPKSQVYVLLIAPCQAMWQSFVVEGTGGRVLVHCTPQYSIDGLLYTEPIRAAYAHAACQGPVGVGAAPAFPDGRPYFSPRSMMETLQSVYPYFGGMPQLVPFTPQPLCVPQYWPGVMCAPTAVPSPLPSSSAAYTLPTWTTGVAPAQGAVAEEIGALPSQTPAAPLALAAAAISSTPSAAPVVAAAVAKTVVTAAMLVTAAQRLPQATVTAATSRPSAPPTPGMRM